MILDFGPVSTNRNFYYHIHHNQHQTTLLVPPPPGFETPQIATGYVSHLLNLNQIKFLWHDFILLPEKVEIATKS